MDTLRVFLFGKFRGFWGEQPLLGLERQQLQELFSYMLLNRAQPQRREVVASLFWQDCPLPRAKKYLRKALWRLQTVLEHESTPSILLVDGDWVQVNTEADIVLDIEIFEQAYAGCRNISGRDLSLEQAVALQEAVDIYQGELLEGWYAEWCIYERGRFQHLYLLMLDKLLDYCTATGCYEAGLEYALLSLRHDPALERTHRAMMRLYYLSGNRTAAMRQYESCCAILRRELNIAPTEWTMALYEQIRSGRPLSVHSRLSEKKPDLLEATQQFAATLPLLRHLKNELARLQDQVEDQINLVAQEAGHSSMPAGKEDPTEASTDGEFRRL